MENNENEVKVIKGKKRRPSVITFIVITCALVVIATVVAYILASNVSSKEIKQAKDQIIEQENKKNDDEIKQKSNQNSGIKTSEEIAEETANISKEYEEFEKLPDEVKESSETIPRKYNVEYDEIYNIIEEQKEYIEEKKDLNNDEENNVIEDDQNDDIEYDFDTIPETFDLRDKIDIEVRDQKSFGDCWAFASVKSAETNLALTQGKYYNLSEIYVDYMLSDGFGIISREAHTGGNFSYFTDLIINKNGLTTEADLPYRDYDSSEYERIKNSDIDVYINSVVDFPTVSKYSNSSSIEGEKLKVFRDTVKRHIMNYGSIYCAALAPDFGTTYMKNNNNLCYKGNGSTGRGLHAVSIIGWDDNYPKENFNSKNQPTTDGAYIAVNSWGYNSVPYIYISYEDLYVESSMSGVISTSFDPNNSMKDIYIDDGELYNKLKETLQNKGAIFNDEKNEIKISEIVLNKITYINFDKCNFKTLNGLENFKSLNSLSLTNCQIEDISAISNLTSLAYLDLSNNNISDISALKKLVSLRNLNLSNNSISDISAIKNLNDISALKIANCNIKNTDLENFSEFKNIYTLNIANNNITDISILSTLDSLTDLDLSGNSNIEIIPDFESLQALNLSDCNLNDLSIVEKFKNIYYLNVSNNNIKSVEQLSSLNNLMRLDVSGNKGIEGFDKLNLTKDEKIIAQRWFNSDYSTKL